MPEQAVTRKLTTILYADVVGYSRLTGLDEESTHHSVMDVLDIAHNSIESKGGTVLRYAGDAILAEFSSVVTCVKTAVDIQSKLAKRNQDIPEDRQVCIRVGINLGDVMEDRGEIYGDGVNIAARLESFAPPGGICVTGQVAEQIAGKTGVDFGNAGRHKFKNIAKPIEVWCWPAENARRMRRRQKSWRGVAAAVILIAAAVGTWFGLAPERTPDLPSGPRIALVPFKSIGGDPNDSYFSEGLTRDINALIAKFSNLFVIAPEAAEPFRDNADCETIHEELGADYFLTGTVQRSADRLRVTTAFTDAESCRQLTPPGPFDVDLSVANILDVQYEIARKVAAQVGSSDAPLFKSAVQQAIRDKAPNSLDAYKCVLLSYWFYQTFGLEAHRKARDCLLRTVEAEPGYSWGWSRLAFNYLESKKRSHETPPDWAERAREAATRAMQEDPDNPDAYYALAILSRMVGEDKDVFRSYAQQAIDLNPNDSWILADLGIFLAYSGEWETGKEWITRARALNPKLHPGFGYAWVLHAIVTGDYEEAINLHSGPHNPMSMTSLIASYALNGDIEEAKSKLADMRKAFPDHLKDPLAPFRARGMPNDLIEKLTEGLQLAGLDVPPDAVGE